MNRVRMVFEEEAKNYLLDEVKMFKASLDEIVNYLDALIERQEYLKKVTKPIS